MRPLSELSSWDKTLLETDIGEFGDYGSKKPLDCNTRRRQENTPLNKLKEWTSKVLCLCKRRDKIKKVTWVTLMAKC